MPGPAPERRPAGAKEKRRPRCDRAASCQILTMVILILSRCFSAIKPRRILQSWKRTRGIRFPYLVRSKRYLKEAVEAGIGRYLGEGAAEMKKALEEKLAAPGKEAAKGAEEAVKKIFGK